MPTRLTANQIERRFEVYRSGTARGLTLRAMADEVGVDSRTFSDWVHSHIHDRPRRIARHAKAIAKPRPCMRCRGEFASFGPGHRLCSACNSYAADASPYAPNDGGHKGRRVSVGRP